MAEQNTYSSYCLTDIERYLEGKMNAREMHDIELAALQDPFLSDAIEGYKAASFTTSYKHLSEIENLLSAQKEQAKIITLPAKHGNWWKIAVAVIIVLGAGIGTWLRMDTHSNFAPEQKDIAANMAKPADTNRVNLQPPPVAQAEVKPVDNAIGASPSKGSVKKTSGYLAVVPAKSKADTITAGYYSTDANQLVASKSGNELSPKVDKDLFLKDSANTTANALNGKINGLSNNAYSNVASPKGPIVQNAQPVNDNRQFYARANTELLKNTDSLSMDDKTALVGRYKAEEKNKNIASLKRAAPAMQNTTTVTNLTVALTPTPSFDTVAVTYLNNKNFKRKMVSDTSLFPQGGWESFRDYVYRKLHKEVDTTGDALATFGDVEVEFTVDNLGNASNLKVTKSLNKQSDAQALDLVRQWPGWISSKKHKKGKVVIQF